MKPHHSITAEQLIHALSALKEGASALESCCQEHIGQARESCRQSARNLPHYLSLRQNDIRAIQDDLSLLGLSRLGQAESHVMGSLNAVLTTLHALAGHVVEALNFLSGVLRRMSEHQVKHRPLLRRLSVCDLPTDSPQRREM